MISTGRHTISYNMLIEYIKSLVDSTIDKSFIKSDVASKVIDFVHIL